MNTLVQPRTASSTSQSSSRVAVASGEPANDSSENISAPLKRIELLSIWAFWGFVAALTFINTLFNDSTTTALHLPAIAPLTAALIDSLIWAMLTPVIFRLTSRYSLEHPHWLLSLTMLLVLGLIISICMTKFMTYVRYEQSVYLNPVGQAAQSMSQPTTMPVTNRFWFMNEFVIYLVALAAGFAHDYFARYRARHEQASALQAQAAHLRAELADSRLNALRSQLNPHFLFNTLNAVSSLVERNPRGARRMIACLSDLLRDTLEVTDLEVSLENELVFIRRYINIMQTRFQGRLEITENLASDTLNAKVPKLLLQPLVENAIKHGIAKMDGIGRIQICAHHHDDMLILSVTDNGSVDPDVRMHEEPEGFGLGLKNTQARLLQSYGDKQSLTLSDQPGGGVIATITLPYHTELKPAYLQ